MIAIYLNNEPMDVDESCSLTQLLLSLDASSSGCAIAINDNFVPRSEHEQTQLWAGDRVELLVPAQGG